ncbi:glycosyltransferase family 2 protein [Cryobacterium sp. TMT2-18-3]|uniref:glycosyltransferase family 2 protein n=1 Tax=unclassified Cryobacterium TaxID=2649013 RepID=UPI00106B4282|nr:MULTISPECIES: glycosyltransferase family 2 protein [unclassified Cryobacterium]TFC27627.1 glycosyltransferase family 2 protein [Cryobacterium sp. TMT2-18-2]TFC66766.1 glycosyltransferase family 2 protein [Cryobacterium sp. TMT2-18-3]
MKGIMSQSVLVITVVYNTGDVLGSFLDSLAASTDLPPDVIVVDNASTDLAVEREAVRAHGARLIELPDNVGYGAGIAAGVQQAGAGYDYLLITNPDVVFTVGALDALVAAASDLPNAGSLGPRILDATGAVYPSARDLPSLRTGIGHAVLGRAWPNNPWSRSYRSDRSYGPERRAAGWLSGACLLVRRSAYEAVGGFDPSYFMYFEDVDFGARLSEAGWENVYVPAAVVTHTGAHSTSRSAHRMERVHHDSAYLYLSRKYSAWYLLPVRGILRVALAARQWWVVR